ncbi:hypothetical protein [Glaciecola sp. XM2]|uniref:hypothetical protein n=1 Tax=Glaciecola sp. XM2 TaxID=1914931 RepID=UPI002032AD10|nr:hypothetical protein [Glaciecola sp. XM2]
MYVARCPILTKALPAILDVEASGFGADSFPIEVGVVMPDGRRFCKLIKPFAQWQFWDKAAESVHGITRAELHARGEEAVGVCLALNDFVDGHTLYSDAWVVDHPWMVKLFAQAAVPMTFSVSAIEMVMSEPQLAIWDAEKSKVIAQSGMQRHRASTDAVIIQQTFQRTKQLMQHSQ